MKNNFNTLNLIYLLTKNDQLCFTPDKCLNGQKTKKKSVVKFRTLGFLMGHIIINTYWLLIRVMGLHSLTHLILTKLYDYHCHSDFTNEDNDPQRWNQTKVH